MKKSLFITHMLDRSGAPIVLLQMMDVFSRNGYSVDVISMTDGELRDDLESRGISVEIIDDPTHHQEELKYYRDSVAQPTLAQKIAGQINDFHRARLTPGFLRDFDPSSRRTKAKMEDMALVWDGYNQVLGEK